MGSGRTSKFPGITADSETGRVLLALRAGPMTPSELTERFGRHPHMSAYGRQGLVEEGSHGWQLTAAGRAACPLRNPLAGKAPTAPPAAMAARLAKPAIGLPGTHVTPEPIRRPVRPEHSGDTTMSTPAPIVTNRVRELLRASPGGISRKSLIFQTGVIASAVDNAIHHLVQKGEAHRPAYGIVALTASAESRPPATDAAPTPAPMEAAQPTPPAEQTMAPKRERPTHNVEFGLWEDGRLSIVDGDEIFQLAPKDTTRLRHFLGCFAEAAA